MCNAHNSVILLGSALALPASGSLTMQPGTILSEKYCVERVLGEGGMGCVVEARHLELGTRVAIKFLLPYALQNADIVTRFEREARATAALQSDHIVNVTDVGRFPDGAPYMVMELLSGCDLATGLSRAGGRLPIAEAVAYGVQAAAGLADAHESGVVHRDVKPANIFLHERKDRRVVVKIVDFGIAKQTEDTSRNLTLASSIMGSPKYMSPEQLRDSKSADARSDIWSLGVTLFEMLAGRTPFAADSMAVLHADILHTPAPSLLEFRPEAPPDLDAILHRCLAKDPAARYASTRDLMIALEQLAMGTSSVSPSFVITSERMPTGVDFTPMPSVFDRTEIADPTPMPEQTGSGVSHTRVSPESAQSSGPPKAKWPLVVAIVAALVVAAIALRPKAEAPAVSAAPAIVAPAAHAGHAGPAPPTPVVAEPAKSPEAAPLAPANAVDAALARPTAAPSSPAPASKAAAPKPASAPAPTKAPAKRGSSLDMSFD